LFFESARAAQLRFGGHNLRVFPERSWLTCLALVSLCLGFVTQSWAYIDLAPTITKIIGDSQRISLVEVVAFNEATHALTLREVKAIKGAPGEAAIIHDVASSDGNIVPPAIVQWAEVGARGVLFSSRTTSLLCFGEGWYQAKSSGGEWKLGVDRSDLPLAYYGSVSRLADGIGTMLAGGDAILTTVQHGADDNAASFDLALNRMNLPGVIRVQRIRANMSMPGTVMSVSVNPAYVVGLGPVGEEELPALVQRLSSPDAAVRADAADDLLQLDRKARSAEGALVKLLADPVERVRISAAAALLRITGNNPEAATVLSKGLSSADAGVRRAAAAAVGRAGSGATPVVAGLAAVLNDQNLQVRRAAVRAVATLGPVAAGVASALVPLLNDPGLMIEAADALGRIGPAARPVPARLVAMLGDNQPTAVRQAALRAMAQIGGPEAHPAVDYIIKTLPSQDEIGQYNMMIYLSLLGPTATDALPSLQNTKITHPVLPTSTAWAIGADSLPWQVEGGGGRGFGGGGFGGGLDLVSSMYGAYFRELGERLRPVALLLLKQMRDGTDKSTPEWGYKLLACAPAEAIAQLSAGLASDDLATRERATLAFGYMGAAAAPAQAKLQAAIAKAPTEREKRLLEWAVRETEAD
jgi:HEAT repeat protein